MARPGRRSDLRERVFQLACEPAYQLADGSPNKSKIAAACGVTRQRVQALLRGVT